MTYNVKNLFDDVDNGTEYDRYDPEKGFWSTALFEEKLRSVADVIRKIPGGGPDIVALQEIENRNVLDQLCDRYLSAQGYQFRIIIPAPHQAAQCAVISRHPIIRVGVLDPGSWEGRQQRYILEIEIEYSGHTLYLFNNHWKSKSGGTGTTEPARLASAGILAKRIKDLLSRNTRADIVVVGDLNVNVDEYRYGESQYLSALIPDTEKAIGASDSIFLTGKANRTGVVEDRLILYELWYENHRDTRGSYVYRGKWQTPDHMLLTAGLFDDHGFFYKRASFRVLNSAFLFDPATGFPWNENDKYSDHLPLLITFQVAG